MTGIFRSFWMGGYEGADHVNGSGTQVHADLANGHAIHYESDYAALAALGIHCVRESAGWRRCGVEGTARHAQSLDGLAERALAAERHGIQIVWTLLHYGVPDGVDFFAPDFPERFAAHCRAVAARLDCRDGASPPVYQPVNEISFLAWAATATGLIHPYLPSSPERGYLLKRALVQAALAGCDAVWAVDPRARMLHTDPLVYVYPADPQDRACSARAAEEDQHQFQAWDMLAGRSAPELGGAPRYLDVVGMNYYHANQWEHPSGKPLDWHRYDSRRQPFAALAAQVWQRYKRPLCISETSHVGTGRAGWFNHMAEAALDCAAHGVPLEGICLYPVLDRPDWEDPDHWHRSGLWDLPDAQRGDLGRQLHFPYAERLRHWQGLVPASTAHSPHISPGVSMKTTVIVFSHLRWDFVYQRPQQLLSRLAAQRPILFVEEPIPGAEQPWLELSSPCAGVQVLRAHVSGTACGFHDDHLATFQRLLGEHVRAQGIGNYLLWFYTPMAFPFAAELHPRGIVYDCMDELSAFMQAPRQLMQRENALFKAADLVLTGGRSLYDSKRARHPDVHCFPSSVDTLHFGQSAQDHPAQSFLGRPRLGYYGVIDERLDMGLVAALADARPAWQVVMVGPVVKIDPANLPRRSNIYWLGQRGYDELPRFLAGWDVCLLPFAMNEATRFISPTKTLEYLAAGRPAVSTPVRDVAEQYSAVVSIASTHTEFVGACEDILERSAEERQNFQNAAQGVVATTSWDRTVAAIEQLLQRFEATAAASPDPVAGGAQVATVPRAPAAEAAAQSSGSPRHYRTIVLGAGPTGLSAALALGEGSLLLEREATVGGWCRSIQDGGYTFDHAGHIMFSTDPFVLDMYQRLLGDNLHWQDREAWIYSKSVYTRYPFQGALYGLPPEVLKECLVGAIEARFGPLKKPGLRVAGAVAEDGHGVAPHGAMPPRNFEDFIYRVWGAGVAKHFAIPYNRKLWAVPLDQMETSWLGGRVPMPNLEEMIEGALQPAGKPMGPNARFGYPLRGGFQALMDGFLPLLEGERQMGADIVAVSPAQRTVTLRDGRSFGYDTLISTLPLPRLVQSMGDEAPEHIREAAAGLRHVSVRCVNLGIAREAVTDKHWVYYPEDTVFHRIFVQGNASPHCNAPGGFGLTCEITYSEYKALPCDGEALVRRCIDDCIRVGMLRADDVVTVANQVDMPFAYVVYDHQRAANVDAIRQWMKQAGILLAGRYSEWEYYNSDHAFVAGRKAAEEACALVPGTRQAAGAAGSAFPGRA